MDDSGLTFREYQKLALRTNRVKSEGIEDIMVPLLGLAGEAGSLLSEYKKWLREGSRYKPFTEQVSEEIGDILWYLANIAEKANLDLQEIAEENLAKVQDRWVKPKHLGALFSYDLERYDSQFPQNERLPTAYRVHFQELDVDGRKKVKVSFQDQPMGDHLTDNSHADDGYRYHDVFHLSLAVLLGWSPILRRLLKAKRKSSPTTDEVEDGARAAATEEAISALAFGYARDYSLFKGSDSVAYDLLRAIKLTTRSLEVRDKTYRDWEEAILKAYAVWRQMIEQGGGTFVGDAATRSITFEPAQ